VILRETAQIFRTERGSPVEFLELNERASTATPQGQPFPLYQHQVEATERASRRESYVVTSGTGSGQSLTYFLPIIDAFLRRPPASDRVGALVVYPMSSLTWPPSRTPFGLAIPGSKRSSPKPPPTSIAPLTAGANFTARPFAK
jgi:hypothetical protein